MPAAARLSRVLVAACLAGALASAAPAMSSAATVPLRDSVPSWATAAALQAPTPDDDVVHARVYLPWRDAAGLAALAHAVSTPGTAQYGHHLSPAEFNARFAPSPADVAAVAAWVRTAGLRVVETSPDGQYVAVEGTAAQARRAFGAALGEYRAFGTVLRAPESAPTVPAALAGKVSAIVGLDEGTDVMRPLTAPTGEAPNGTTPAKVADPGVGFRAGTTCSTSWGEKTVTLPSAIDGSTVKPLAPCGYTPAQVRGLYGLGSADTGAGQTVAFVGANASPTIVADVTQYSRLHNLPDPQISQVVPPGIYQHPTTPKNDPGSFFGEQTLDAEAIHTTAPAARLLYVASSNANQDFDRSIKQIVTKHLAPIISISYGFSGEAVPQGFVNSLNGIFVQAVATGVGIFVSSGDDGDNQSTLGKTSVDFYANSPNVTAVGGTSAAIVPGAGGSIFPSGSAAAIPASSSASGGGIYGIDDPKNAVNQPGWTRAFEVGWQTGFTAATGTLAPVPTGRTAPSAKQYTFAGTLDPAAPTFSGGGGGGVSAVFAQPSYQKGITDGARDGTSGAAGTTGRALPDISALADPNTGFLVGQTQKFTDGSYYDEYRIGGTSLAAPLIAGMAAVANQKAGRDLGFLNPRIYAAYRQANATIYDVDAADLNSPAEFGSTPAVFRVNFTDSESAAGGRTYSVRTLETSNQSLHSVRGYDTATGVGSPRDASFLAALGSVTPLAYTPDSKSPKVGG